MDDMWGASRGHSSKQFSPHPSSGNHVVLDNSEVNDDARTYFTCPFCYIDTELSLLCNHLQDDHCFVVKNAVCPVCALNLGKDVAGHFKVHHANSIKKKSQKSGFWSFCAGRNLLGGLNAKNGLENVNASAPDPLLFPFLFSVPYSECNENQSQLSSSSEDVSYRPDTESCSPKIVLNQSESKGNIEEIQQRVEFCQHLFSSTIL